MNFTNFDSVLKNFFIIANYGKNMDYLLKFLNFLQGF